MLPQIFRFYQLKLLHKQYVVEINMPSHIALNFFSFDASCYLKYHKKITIFLIWQITKTVFCAELDHPL